MNKQEITTKIIKNTDIYALISQDINLKKKGANFVGLCPFHDDTSPSLSVSVSKQIFKCFACGESGNIISYLMKARNFSFQHAIEFLNQEFNLGLDLSKLTKKQVRVYTEVELQALRALENSAKIFTTALFIEIYGVGKNTNKLKENSQIQYFLKQRGINRSIIEKFKIGWDSGLLLKSQLVDSDLKFDQLVLENYSLLSSYGHDFFKNRIVFPIENEEGKIVGFSGRCLNDQKCEPKYLNSLTNSLFSKSEILYNFANAILDSGTQEIILTEGFFDVIAFYKAGIKNVVGLMGTSLSKKHCQMLSNYTIIIALDDDKAGKLASLKIAQALAEYNIKSYILTDLKGCDPDEFYNKFGAFALVDLLKKRQSSLDFAYEFYKSEIINNSSEEIKKFIKNFQPFLDFLGMQNDKTTLGFFLEKIEKEIGVPKNSINFRIQNYFQPDYELEINAEFLENTHNKPKFVSNLPKITPIHCELKTIALVLADFIWGKKRLFNLLQNVNYKFIDIKNANIIHKLAIKDDDIDPIKNAEKIFLEIEEKIKKNIINIIYENIEDAEIIPKSPISENEFLEWLMQCDSLRERFNKNNMQQKFLSDSKNESAKTAFSSIYPVNK